MALKLKIRLFLSKKYMEDPEFIFTVLFELRELDATEKNIDSCITVLEDETNRYLFKLFGKEKRMSILRNAIEKQRKDLQILKKNIETINLRDFVSDPEIETEYNKLLTISSFTQDFDDLCDRYSAFHQRFLKKTLSRK